jgi:uncharacterized protein (DUF2235 family)
LLQRILWAGVMKRLAIFCDGTWNKLSGPFPTNVVLAARAVALRAPDGIEQITYYNEGVGTTWTVHEGIEKRFAGAFGRGLLDKIADAYRFLIFNYAPGDEIYIFGFSRGAFTARSLAGMIRKCGILRKDQAGAIGEAFNFYKRADVKPSDPDAAEFRKLYARDEQMEDSVRLLSGDGEAAAAEPFTIRFLGVWDTVGALGVPKYLRISDLLGHADEFRFHDHELSSIVEYASHALALDEDRRAFEATPWKNLPKLNALPGRAGHYAQLWFPGDHGSVGGGGDERRHSNAALIWILEGAEKAGLVFEPDLLAENRAHRNFLAPLKNDSTEPAWWRRLTDAVLFPRAPRTGPLCKKSLSEGAVNRLHNEAKAKGWPYRPRSILPLLREMFPDEFDRG